MVIGQCTRSDAAAHCRCKEEDLCPCPMAGIDESDKIRSIIQQNAVEKTTAPTVMDCVQCLHWLRASRSRENPGALGPEPLEPDDSNDKPPGRVPWPAARHHVLLRQQRFQRRLRPALEFPRTY